MLQIVAALILAGGAFYGVWKGAIYAANRLSAQMAEQRDLADRRLDAEARRLQTQLDAEAARLDKQLAHDRWARDVEELRRMVDEAATAGLAAANKLHTFRGQIRFHVEEGDPLNDKYTEKRRDAQLAIEAMSGYVERFEVRLGPGNDVPLAMTAWQLSLEESWDSFDAPPSKEALREGSKKLSDSASEYRAFMKMARGYVRIEDPRTP